MTLDLASEVRRTRQMRRVEAEQGEEIVPLLRRLYHEESLTVPEIAERIEVPVQTLYTWIAKFGLDRASLARRALEQSA